MKSKDCYINTNPNRQDIEEILDWLKEEKIQNGVSFYCNKNVIEEKFESGYSIVFKYNEENIGLVIWNEYDDSIHVDIDIFVIHPNYRNQGFGRFYYNEVLNFFRSCGFKIIKLFCEPKTSELFWKKMGLIKFPDCGCYQPELTYYIILVDNASMKHKRTTDMIELWDVEPYKAAEQKPKWIWYVEIKDGKLLNPIIHPCNCDWKLRWSRNGNVIREEKVKYFTSENYELYFSPFVYIDKLEE